MVALSVSIRPPRSRDELIEHINGYVEVAQSFSPDPLPADGSSALTEVDDSSWLSSGAGT